MSGGTFDYKQEVLAAVVEEIERTLADNGKTVKQLSAEKERHGCFDADDLACGVWSSERCPYWVGDLAEARADEALGLDKRDGRNATRKFSDLTEKEKKAWNKARKAEIKRMIDEHNNSCPVCNYSPKVVSVIRDEMLPTIKKALIYLNRIDYLLAGDDGEESFLKRTKEEIGELEKAKLPDTMGESKYDEQMTLPDDFQIGYPYDYEPNYPNEVSGVCPDEGWEEYIAMRPDYRAKGKGRGRNHRGSVGEQ